jgi:hypothetical protein
MSETKEYVVTLRSRQDIDSFYEDMESTEGTLYIPNRKVDIANIREISRNTHYYLTDEEANILRNDPRILAVEKLPKELNLVPITFWSQTDNFEKSNTIDSNDKNWGLYSVTSGTPLSNWGTNGSFTQTTQTIYTTSSGKNVDVVINDAHINGNHPEFAVNSDGTGGSRFVSYDWFQHSSALGYVTTLPYSYSAVSSNHGTHVAGTVAGNTQGWARDANIYNIEFNYASSGGPAGSWELYIYDYVREFHKTKPINTTTGRRNPTIVNNSWGYAYTTLFLSNITQLNYRGNVISVSGTDEQKKATLETYGIPVASSNALVRTPARYAALDADVEDAIADGVIFVGSSGNSYWNANTESDLDYNNSFLYGGGYNETVYPMRGSTPTASGTSICVGAIDVVTEEYKTTFSNYGSRVEVYAPGRFITSSVYGFSAQSEFGVTLVTDPRNNIYYLGSISGTSMASPQVTGLLACLLENFPSMTQSEIKTYIENNSTSNRISSTGGGAADYTSLGVNSNNRYLFYKKERGLTGYVAINTVKNRSGTGNVYPRTKIRRFG